MHSLDERRQSLITQITAGEYEVEESLLRIKSQETEYANEVAELLHAARLNLSDLSQKLKAAMDVLSRTEVLAPYDGIVINLHANTLGGCLVPVKQSWKLCPPMLRTWYLHAFGRVISM